MPGAILVLGLSFFKMWVDSLLRKRLLLTLSKIPERILYSVLSLASCLLPSRATCIKFVFLFACSVSFFPMENCDRT